MSTWDIRVALRQQVLAVPGFPAKVEWENVQFPENARPAPDEAWARIVYIPVSERLFASGLEEVIGLHQVSLFFPRDSGVKEADILADAVKQAFPPGSSIGGQARVIFSERNPSVPGSDHYHVPVTIRWQAHRARGT